MYLNESEQDSLIQELMNESLSGKTETVFDTHRKIKTQGDNAYDLSSGQEFWKELAFLAPAIKHKSFVEENEWRIVSDNLIDIRNDKVRFQLGKTYLTPHSEINLNCCNSFNDLIFKVLIGPTPSIELTYNSIEMLLLDNGFEPKDILDKTETTYRN